MSLDPSLQDEGREEERFVLLEGAGWIEPLVLVIVSTALSLCLRSLISPDSPVGSEESDVNLDQSHELRGVARVPPHDKLLKCNFFTGRISPVCHVNSCIN